MEKSNIYSPKVLILNQPFINTTGGGITLSSLFAGWDKNKIAVACTPHFFNLNINTSVCSNYYRLGEKEFKYPFPFNLFQNKYKSGPVEFLSSSPPQTTRRGPSLRKMILDNFLNPILEYFSLNHNLSRIELSPKFCHWLDNYKPDLIYAQAFSLEGVKFCIDVQNYLKKPMAFHMMDDWPTFAAEKGLFRKFWFKRIDETLRTLFDKSSLLLSISEEMSKEYMNRYNKEFVHFHNAIDINQWEKFQRKSYELNEKPYILYSGRTGLGIDSSLKMIAKAVEIINTDFDINIRFIIRTEHRPNWMKHHPYVEYKDYVNYEEVPKILAEADILILPYDFSHESIKFIRFSMPTKAPEYMMSGTPIILFAHEDTALVKYGEKYNCFKIVSENKLDLLIEAIKDLVLNLKRRQDIAKRAVFVASTMHTSQDIASIFRTKLCSLTINTENSKK